MSFLWKASVNSQYRKIEIRKVFRFTQFCQEIRGKKTCTKVQATHATFGHSGFLHENDTDKENSTRIITTLFANI